MSWGQAGSSGSAAGSRLAIINSTSASRQMHAVQVNVDIMTFCEKSRQHIRAYQCCNINIISAHPDRAHHYVSMRLPCTASGWTYSNPWAPRSSPTCMENTCTAAGLLHNPAEELPYAVHQQYSLMCSTLPTKYTAAVHCSSTLQQYTAAAHLLRRAAGGCHTLLAPLPLRKHHAIGFNKPTTIDALSGSGACLLASIYPTLRRRKQSPTELQYFPVWV
jgi:hypothetical protein